MAATSNAPVPASSTLQKAILDHLQLYKNVESMCRTSSICKGVRARQVATTMEVLQAELKAMVELGLIETNTYGRYRLPVLPTHHI